MIFKRRQPKRLDYQALRYEDPLEADRILVELLGSESRYHLYVQGDGDTISAHATLFRQDGVMETTCPACMLRREVLERLVLGDAA